MLLEKEQQTMKNVIEADNICKSFGKNHVLKGLSFQVPEGAIYAICGKNGIGKSVLFRILTGFILPDTGSVKIHGQQIGIDLEFPKSTGILIDRPGYMPDSSGYANLALLGQISGLADEETIRASLGWLVWIRTTESRPHVFGWHVAAAGFGASHHGRPTIDFIGRTHFRFGLRKSDRNARTLPETSRPRQNHSFYQSQSLGSQQGQ